MKGILVRLLVLLAVASLGTLPGCSWLGQYGSLRLQAPGAERLTMERLVEKWEAYDVFYAAIALHRPSAILFDPKGDGLTLQVHPWWVRVEEKETLLEIVKWMEADKTFDPALWRVLGPDGRLFGFMYTAWTHALIKVVDERTLWVDDLSRPPERLGGGAVEGRSGNN